MANELSREQPDGGGGGGGGGLGTLAFEVPAAVLGPVCQERTERPAANGNPPQLQTRTQGGRRISAHRWGKGGGLRMGSAVDLKR